MFSGLPAPRQQLVESIDRVSIDRPLEHVAQAGVGFDVVHLAGSDERAQRRPSGSALIGACKEMVLSSSHSAHIGQEVVIHYRWHPLYGQSASRVQIERRATGEFVHVELAPGVVAVLPAWKLDAVYCASLKVGAP